MANDWIKMRSNLTEDPAVIGIAAATKLDVFAVVGRLHCFWGWVDQHSEDGFMPHVTAAVIDTKVAKKGFAAAVEQVGWLAIESGGVRVPHYDRHNGTSAKKRAIETDKKRRQREGQSGEMVPEFVPPDTGQKSDMSGTRVEKSKQQQQKRLVSVLDFPDIARQFPGVDLHAQLAAARVYVRGQRGPTAEVECEWFVEHWLPKAPRSSAFQVASDAVPEGFAEWFDAEFPGVDPDTRRGYVEGKWSAVPREIRDKFSKSQKGAA